MIHGRAVRKPAAALALCLLLAAVTPACCPPLCLGGDPCNEPIQHQPNADDVFDERQQTNVHTELPDNVDNYFRAFMHPGEPPLSDDEAGAYGVAFRARLMDGQDLDGFQRPSTLFINYVLAYEFPAKECAVDLFWEVDPSVRIPGGLEIDAPGSTTPSIDFELSIIEDPTGQFSADSIPDAVLQDNIVARVRFTEPFSDARSLFRDDYDGQFRVPANTTSRLFVRLGVLLWASGAGDRLCIGCSLPPSQKNHVLDSAVFYVGGGNDRGPFWYMQRPD